ncbi:uncharacterized protein B0H18DRAFT_1122819 [Fomitopsis serialis]|uniref:uncharacterized protein n=1 Tax=Fomitopsis serialis TaxID=139415 RepID=UPI002007C475|nr:uncharacterized protein B0H18DRAFT_1122819 [Neoantrodia serialis]KAH9918845.1 hypothetical protein B0H18DRAFT_1122819 [Neoantrodia serialis]
MPSEIISSCFAKAKQLQVTGGFVKLERGFATVPLPGIDAPRCLWAGVILQNIPLEEDQRRASQEFATYLGLIVSA